jgi:SAM-dependent methyltransferase
LIDRLPRPVQRLLRTGKRELRALLLSGDTVECPVCHSGFRHMLGPRGRQVICPRCSSLERHRRVILFLRRCTDLYSAELRVLHIAPEYGIHADLKRLSNLDYVTGDIDGDGVDLAFDITAIPFADETFDVILCSHVLEHVQDDCRALREIARVLRPDGWALINVPSDPGRTEIYEDDSIVDPKARVEHFGQEDHVRVYSQRGFLERVRDAGFGVVVVDPLKFNAYERARYVLDGDDGWDHSYLCSRPGERADAGPQRDR